jgi:hypothetical protein
MIDDEYGDVHLNSLSTYSQNPETNLSVYEGSHVSFDRLPAS